MSDVGGPRRPGTGSDGSCTAIPGPAETAVDPEGFVFDVATGEVLGHVGARESGDPDRFAVRDEDAANWVLELKMAEEARLVAIEARRSAINANLDGQRVGPEARLRWLSLRFDGELAAWARARLDQLGGNARTVKLAFGRVAFRRSGGSAEVLDPAAALRYVEDWAPEKVRKSVGIEAVRAAIEAERGATGEDPDVAAFFRASGPRETVTITTGIGKEAHA